MPRVLTIGIVGVLERCSGVDFGHNVCQVKCVRDIILTDLYCTMSLVILALT